MFCFKKGDSIPPLPTSIQALINNNKYFRITIIKDFPSDSRRARLVRCKSYIRSALDVLTTKKLCHQLYSHRRIISSAYLILMSAKFCTFFYISCTCIYIYRQAHIYVCVCVYTRCT